MENCPLCDEDTPTLEKQIESVVIDMIRRNNPQWVEADGACRKCVVYYRSLNKLVELDD